MLSQTIIEYAQGPWTPSARNTSLLEAYHGLYYRGNALVVQETPELKRSILQELHDVAM